MQCNVIIKSKFGTIKDYVIAFYQSNKIGIMLNEILIKIKVSNYLFFDPELLNKQAEITLKSIWDPIKYLVLLEFY